MKEYTLCLAFALLIAQSCTGQLRTASVPGFKAHGTCKGQVINAHSLLSLLPAVPGELQRDVDALLQKDQELARMLSGEDYTTPIQGTSVMPYCLSGAQTPKLLASYFAPIKEVLLRYGIKTDTPWLNYVLPLNDKWLIKASGLANRKYTVKMSLGLPYDTILTQDHIEQFKRDYGTTFQTISRISYWLRLAEIQAALNLDRIGVQKKYLVHIHGRPTHVDDTNYIIVVERIENAQPITETALLNDPEVIKQLAYAIGYTGLWNIDSDNTMTANGMVYLIDTEQPHVHKIQDFFHKDGAVYRSNAHHGWGELKKMIRSYAQSHADVDAPALEQIINHVATELDALWQS